MSPRSVTSSVPASAPNVRPSTVSRAGTATGGSPVDETSAQANVSFNTAMLFQNNGETGEQNDEPSNGKVLVEYAVNNQTFASILEDSVQAPGRRAAGHGARRVFSGYVTRAIKIYESNAEVIHGSGPEPRGSTLSLAL